MDTIKQARQPRRLNGAVFLALCYLLAVLCGVLFVLMMIPIIVHYHDLSTDHWR